MANIIKRVWNQNRMVQIEDLKGMTFQAEQAGHTFQISGIDDDGNTVALTGTPAGVLLRPDNTDVALTCSVSGGVVSATLPANCYDVPGRFGLTIFITSGSSKTAIYAAVGTVTRTSSGTAAPGTTQSVVDLINAINAAINSIPASYSALLADIAPTYSNSALYSVGQYTWYDGDLKRCIVPITTAESYTAAHWTSAVLGQDVSDLKSATDSNTKACTSKDFFSKKSYGIYASNGNYFSSENHNASETYPVKSGDTIRYNLRGTSNAVALIAFYNSGMTFDTVNVVKGNGESNDVTGIFTAPSDGYIRACNRKDNPNGYIIFENELPYFETETVKRISFLEKNAAYPVEYPYAARILSSSGAASSNANHHATDYIPVKTGETIYYTLTGTDGTVSVVYLYNTSKVAVSSIALGAGSSNPVSGNYTFLQDGYIRACCRNDYLTNAKLFFKKSVAYNTMKIEQIENGAGQATIQKCRNQIENTYSLSDWKRGGTSKRNFALMMFSDLHGDTERLKNAISVLNGVETIDAGIFLGDMEDSNQSAKMASTYIPAFNVATKTCLATMGNHDFHHSNSMTSNPYTLEQSVARFMGAMNDSSVYSSHGYGYKDFSTYKVRLIVLNQYEYPDANDGTNWTYYGSGRFYQQNQIDWLITTLNSVPSDYTVIIAQHSTEPADTQNSVINTHYGASGCSGGVDAHSTYIGNLGYMSDQIIGDIIKAYQGKTTLSKSYTYSTTSTGYTGVSVSADFSSANGTFACIICGHNHAQAFCKQGSTIPVYVNDTSNCQHGWATAYSLIARHDDGFSGDLITVLCLDTANKYLHFVRIGANRNFFGELYDVVSVTYGT